MPGSLVDADEVAVDERYLEEVLVVEQHFAIALDGGAQKVARAAVFGRVLVVLERVVERQADHVVVLLVADQYGVLAAVLLQADERVEHAQLHRRIRR